MRPRLEESSKSKRNEYIRIYRSIFGTINNLSILVTFVFVNWRRFVLFRGREVGMYREACETCAVCRENENSWAAIVALNSTFYTCLARVSWPLHIVIGILTNESYVFDLLQFGIIFRRWRWSFIFDIFFTLYFHQFTISRPVYLTM